MDVVGHQHIRVDRAATGVGGIGQESAKLGIVPIAEEDGLAIVAALDHVKGLVR